MLDIKGHALFPIYDVQDNLNDIVWDIHKFMLLQFSLIFLIGINIRKVCYLTFLTLTRALPYLNECLESFISIKWMLLNLHIHIVFSFSNEKYKYADNLGVNTANLILLILNMK